MEQRGLKLARLPLSLAATLAALPSISEIPFLDSSVPAFLIKFSVSSVQSVPSESVDNALLRPPCSLL